MAIHPRKWRGLQSSIFICTIDHDSIRLLELSLGFSTSIEYSTYIGLTFCFFSLVQSQSKSILAHQSSASQMRAEDLPQEQANDRAVLKSTSLTPSPTGPPPALLAVNDVQQTDQNQPTTTPDVLVDDQPSSAAEIGVRSPDLPSPDLPSPDQEQPATASTKRYSVRLCSRRWSSNEKWRVRGYSKTCLQWRKMNKYLFSILAWMFTLPKGFFTKS